MGNGVQVFTQEIFVLILLMIFRSDPSLSHLAENPCCAFEDLGSAPKMGHLGLYDFFGLIWMKLLQGHLGFNINGLLKT